MGADVVCLVPQAPGHLHTINIPAASMHKLSRTAMEDSSAELCALGRGGNVVKGMQTLYNAIQTRGDVASSHESTSQGCCSPLCSSPDSHMQAQRCRDSADSHAALQCTAGKLEEHASRAVLGAVGEQAQESASTQQDAAAAPASIPAASSNADLSHAALVRSSTTSSASSGGLPPRRKRTGRQRPPAPPPMISPFAMPEVQAARPPPEPVRQSQKSGVASSAHHDNAHKQGQHLHAPRPQGAPARGPGIMCGLFGGHASPVSAHDAAEKAEILQPSHHTALPDPAAIAGRDGKVDIAVAAGAEIAAAHCTNPVPNSTGALLGTRANNYAAAGALCTSSVHGHAAQGNGSSSKPSSKSGLGWFSRLGLLCCPPTVTASSSPGGAYSPTPMSEANSRKQSYQQNAS